MGLSRRLFVGLAAGIVGLAAPLAATAADLSDETVTITVPYREGGGTDTWARFLAAQLPQHMENAPTVVVRNLTAGGGIGGANEFARRAKDNGLDLLGTAGGLQLPFLLGDERVRYDYADWYPVFASPFGGVVYTRSEDAPASPSDLMEREGIRFGSIGASGSDLVPLIAFHLLGLDTNVGFGLNGRGPARLSILRGETDIDYQTSSSYIKNVQPLVDEGTMTPIFSWGVLTADGTVERDPTFPDLPSFPEYYEMIHGERPSGPGWEAWKAVFAAGFAHQKFIVLPTSSPDDIKAMWRETFDQMAQNEEFQAAARAQLGAYQQIHGDAVDAALTVATTMPEASREWITTWLKETYDFEL